MSTFVTSDPHFGHQAIIGYCQRPFETLEQMTNVIIDRWNEKVKPKDDVFLLGDVFVGLKQREAMAIRSKLVGNIHLIAGNHDEVAKGMPRAWAWIKDLYELKFQKFHAIMCHYPLRSWPGNTHGVINLHGHCHGNMAPCANYPQLDVGVDVHAFYPVAIEAVQGIVDMPLEFDAPATNDELNDLVRHMWMYDGYPDNGVRTMSVRQASLYRLITRPRKQAPRRVAA